MAKPSFSRKTSPLQQTVLAGLACWLALAGAFLHVRPVQAAALTITPAGDTLPAVVGENWSQTYTVSGGDGNYTCSMDGTIPGLSFNAATLTLSGSPDDFGSYPVTISCTDGASPKNEGTYALNFRAEAPTQTTILTLRSDYPGGGYVAGYAIWVRADVSFNPAITGKQPTGTIVVSSGTGGPTCSDTLDANGEGECALIFPTSGTRTIQVSYTGTTDVLASTASAAPITILPLDAPPLLSAGRHHTCYLNPEGVMTCWGLGDGFAPPVEGADPLPKGTYTKISAGGFQTCGLLVDGTIACWGENTEVTQNIPAGKFVDISAGDEHVCAVDTVNKLHCWGSGAVVDSVPTVRVTAVSAGTGYDCAIRKSNNQPVCWGSLTNPPTDAVKALAVGNTHTCAIKTDGTLRCWGLPAMTPPAGTYQAIDSGSDYSCAQKTDGTIACWGSNAPAVDASTAFTRFTSGFLHTCALQPSGPAHTLSCWGNNTNGQAPRITLSPTGLPGFLRNDAAFSQAFTPGGGNAPYTITVPGGSNLPAGLTLTNGAISGTPATAGVYTFSLSVAETFTGSSLPLQLSPGRQAYTTTVYSTATTTALALDLATVNAGSPVQATVTVTRGALGPAMNGEVEVSSTDGDATCRAAVNAAGNAVCTLYFSAPGAKLVKADYLENDDYAGSASGQVGVTVNPVVIEPIVGAGDQFTCSIDSNGHLFCWGTNDSGQSTPPNWGVYDQLDLGMSHACAVGLNRQVKCWGWNGPNNLISPPLVYGAVRVTTGNSHSCLLTDYGYARCWGDASSSSARLQVPYPFNYDYAKIDAGADHTCAITKSGAIRCWGLNTRGQISTAPTTGTYTDISAGGDLSCALNAAGTPSCWGSLATAPAGPFASLSAGKDFACGLKSDGGVTCWGSRNDTLTGPFSQISAGADHVCGLLQSGRMQCWGGDAKGQAPVIAITPASLPTIDVGETLPAQSTPLALNASGGRINQYAYSISTGSLPAGLNLNSSDGKISGTPTQSGVFNFTVRAQEANLDPAIVAENSYTLTVRGRVDAAVDSAQPSGAMVGRPIEVHFSVHARPGYAMSGEPTGVVTVTAEDNHCEVSLTNGTGSCLMVFVTPGAKTITIDYPGDSLYLPGQPASAFTYTVTAFSQPPQILTGLDRTIVHKADGTVGCIGGVCALDQLGGVFTRVGIGDDFACGLQYHEFPQDNVIRGEVVCAVDDAADALNFSNSPYIDLAVGNHHACALKIDGTVECQGDNTSGQAAPPAGVYTSLSAGGGHTCALNGSGEAACWGAIAAPPAGPFTHLTSGDAHTCGLKHDGSVICWGDNSAGQSTVPVAPAAFAQIAAGGNQTCGLDAEGHAACWGDNAAGQAEPAYGHFISVDTDADHTCALRAGLGFTCWGNDGLSAPGAPQFTIAQLTETEIPALTAFLHDFGVTGGSEPLIAGIFAGRLPDGMCVGAECGPGTNVEPQTGFTPQDLSPAGLRLSGTPTLPGEYEFAIRWSDASPYPLVMEQPYWLTVTGGDLAVTLAPVLSPSALEGMDYSFTAEVTNHTALPVPGVVLTLDLPDGLTAIRSDNPACTIDDSTLTCPLGTVDPAETQSIEVTGTVTQRSGETFTVSAAVESNDPDWPEIDPGDNQTSLSVPVTANMKILDLRFDEETLGVLIAKSAGPNTLTLSGLPNHQSIRISFDLYIIGEWQGNPWALSADGRTLLNTSFSNDPDYCQAYPANLPGCSNPAQRGAVGINELGYEEKPDSRYHLTYRFAHSDDDISWIFDAPDMPDEAEWGLDNLVVEVDNGQTKVYLPMVVTSK